MTAASSDVFDDAGGGPIRVGISACLLGGKVRFDGGHKRDAFLTETFGRFVEWVPVCPEVECGLGTPRESMRLVRVEDRVRLLTVKSGVDLTVRMERFSRSRVSALVGEDLSGFVLKKDSPSCGLERVKVYDGHGTPARGGRGLFAAALVDAFPHLPVEEEGRLADPLHAVQPFVVPRMAVEPNPVVALPKAPSSVVGHEPLQHVDHRRVAHRWIDQWLIPSRPRQSGDATRSSD